MNEADALALADLKQTWGEGHERRALCPFCGDGHKADKEHATLAYNVDTGVWQCHRCGRAGLLREHWTELEPRPRRRARPRPRPAPPAPTPAELAERAERRATLRRMWTAAAPIDAPPAAPGVVYLQGRAIPVEVATEARVRFSSDWYGRPAVVFPVQGERGGLVAGEGRHTDGRADPKTHTVGEKGAGVFLAMPGALDAEGVTVCEGPITALSIAAAGYPALALCGQKAPAWLARRLALRTVLIAFDEGEERTEEKAAALAAGFVRYGVKVFRLRCPAAVGDWNDYLMGYGRDAVDRELAGAVLRTLH